MSFYKQKIPNGIHSEYGFDLSLFLSRRHKHLDDDLNTVIRYGNTLPTATSELDKY